MVVGIAPHLPQANSPQNARLQGLIQRATFLRSQGQTGETSEELARILKIINFMQQPQHQLAKSASMSSIQSQGEAMPADTPHSNGLQALNGMPVVSTSANGSIQQPPFMTPQTHSAPVLLTPEQTHALRAQIAAFRSLQRGAPLSDSVIQYIYPPAPKEIQTVAREGKENKPSDMEGIEVEGAEKQPFLEDRQDSGIFPYNAYSDPSEYIPASPQRQRRVLIPSLTPIGLDPHQMIAERNRFIEARIQQRYSELATLPSDMGGAALEPPPLGDHPKEATSDRLALTSEAHGKTLALIELKALGLLNKQRLMRAQVVDRLVHGSLIPVDRKDLRRFRKPNLKDVRTTEQLERKQRQDRERRAKQKHLDYLNVICQHGATNVLASRRAQQNKVIGLGRRILSYHGQTEKEEQKRIERISKERLKALKADDEEAYLKLIDTAKDTRITHLLRQTDQFLDSLAQAVVAQQSEAGRPLPPIKEATDETTFGAQRLDDEDDRPKVDYYSIAHRISENVSAQPSILVGGTLKDYQVKGLQWMVSLYNNHLNGILADEMGLGKTIQTISLITFLIEKKQIPGPFLVIVPLSTITNWTNEFLKWAPSVSLLTYKGSPNVRRGLQTQLRMERFQVVLTTYEYIIKDRPVLGKIRWVHMIIDEGHRMKNTQSKLAQTLVQFYHTKYRLILTGTPLQNNLPELWALLNFVLPKVFNSVKSFDEWFNTPFANAGSADQMQLNEEEKLLIIKRLHKVLRPFLLRRLKKDVESELPDKVEKVVKVKMSALQTQLYKQLKKHKQIASGGAGKEKPLRGLNNELMQLRKICQHPFLFGTVEDTISPGPNMDESLVRSSGKVEMLSRILPKFFATGHRVLIFFQMTHVMDIMADFLRWMGWEFLRLDGGTKPEERAEYVKLFNDFGSPYKVFILSTRAGGLGLNLQTADTVIIYDSDWNPHADLQAQDRAHRIGQTKAVRILRFITEKSVEEAMFARARFKLGMDEKVIQAGRFDNKSTQEDSDDLLRAILEADNEDDGTEESGIMNDDEINEIIARSEDEIRIFREMDVERERAAEERWRAAGNRGPRPPPLMSLEELPAYWQTDEVYDARDEEVGIEGRGARKRQVVNYSDGLTDEQFAMALEEEEDLEEAIERNRERKERRANKAKSDGADTPRKNKAKPRVVVDEYDQSTWSGKRKRGTKEASVSPSINDDDEDVRDAKKRKVKVPAPDPTMLAKMKKLFLQIHNAVSACTDKSGRKRYELFKELPDKKDYPDYYISIKQPISMNQIRKRINSSYYKSLGQFTADWQLMFGNARTYNQEGSWVYVDAEEMEKVFNDATSRLVAGSGMPGSENMEVLGTAGSGGEEDTPPQPRSKSSSRVARQILSDDDDDDYLSDNSDE